MQSAYVSDEASDFEFTIEALNNIAFHGDLEVAGSVLLTAGNSIEVYDGEIETTGAGQTVRFEAPDMVFGKTEGNENLSAAIRGTARIEVEAENQVWIKSGVKIATEETDSVIAVTAPDITVIGALYAGAELDEDNNEVWTGTSADVVIEAANLLVIGGDRVDESGDPVHTGGTIQATGLLDLTFVAGMTVMEESAVLVDATGGGVLTPLEAGLIRITGDSTLQVYGLIEALDEEDDVEINSAELALIDGLIQGNDAVTITGGAHSSGAGIAVQPLVLLTDSASGYLVDENERLMDADGYLVDVDGNHVDENGDPVTAGNEVEGGAPIRVSGGTVNSLGGVITLTALADVLVHGTVGDVSEEGETVTADAAEVIITSQTGDVSSTGYINAADGVSLSGSSVHILSGSSLKVRASGGTALLQVTDMVYVAPASGDLAAGIVQVDTDIHFLAGGIFVEGFVQSNAAGRILFNAEDELTILGLVESLGDLELNAGIDRDWTLTQLESGAMVVGDLSDGDINVLSGGALDGVGDVTLSVGGNVFIEGSSSITGSKTIWTPIITTEEVAIETVSGYHLALDSVIEVPEIIWVSTVVTEQVGFEDVKVGSYFHTMDVTLVQDSYYNPQALASEQVKETFIEGVDYYNNTDASYGNFPGIEIINWAAFDVLDEPSSDYIGNASAYRTFQQLTDTQRSAVLETLGYMPLYNFIYANPEEHMTLDGTPVTVPWIPDWDVSDEPYSDWSVWDNYADEDPNTAEVVDDLLGSGYTESNPYYVVPVAEPDVEFLLPSSGFFNPTDGYYFSDDFSTGSGNWSYDNDANYNSFDDCIALTEWPTGSISQNGLAVYDTPMSTDAGFVVEFQYKAYNDGTDSYGLTFFLTDGETTDVTVGSGGGSTLGYAGTISNDGVPNAYMGVAFDNSGSFDGALSGDASFGTNSVVVAGSGHGDRSDEDYRYLTHTETDNINYSLKLGDEDEWYDVRIIFTPDEHITVMMNWNEGSTWYTIIDDFDVGSAEGQADLPDTVKFGFTATSSTTFHYVDNVKIMPLIQMRTRPSTGDSWSDWTSFSHDIGETQSAQLVDQALFLEENGFTAADSIYSKPSDELVNFNSTADGNLYMQTSTSEWVLADVPDKTKLF